MATIPSSFQDEYLYGLIWPKAVTEALVTFLLTQKATGNWSWNSNNLLAITAARSYLNETVHTDYSTIEVLGRVKKLRSRFNLFDHMISVSGVEWNREMNYLFATPHQWRLWRKIYPMSRAYLTAGEPLYNELKGLFAPDADDGNDDVVIVIDSSDDDDYYVVDHDVVHALPAAIHYPPDEDIVVISSDDDDSFINGLFDSDLDLDFSDEEGDDASIMAEENVSSVLNEQPPTAVVVNSEDEVISPVVSIPIISASIAAIHESLRSIPQMVLRDESESSYESD